MIKKLLKIISCSSLAQQPSYRPNHTRELFDSTRPFPPRDYYWSIPQVDLNFSSHILISINPPLKFITHSALRNQQTGQMSQLPELMYASLSIIFFALHRAFPFTLIFYALSRFLIV